MPGDSSLGRLRLRPDHYQELPSPREGFTIFDMRRLLKEGHPNWQGEMVNLARFARPQVHTGHDDPTSRMKPGDPEIIAYRLPATTVEEHAPWFNDVIRATVGLARLAFNMPTLVGPGDDLMSLYDCNIAFGDDGERHVDSLTGRAAVLCVAAPDGSIVTRYADKPGGSIEDGYFDIELEPGQIAFGPGHEREHQGIYTGYRLGTSAVRITVSPGYWEANGPNALDPEKRAASRRILYGMS